MNYISRRLFPLFRKIGLERLLTDKPGLFIKKRTKKQKLKAWENLYDYKGNPDKPICPPYLFFK